MKSDDFEQLVDDVIFEAGDRVAAFEWGEAGARHDKSLKEAKDAVLAEHERLLTLIRSSLEALSMNATFPADIELAKKNLREALEAK